MNVKRVKFTEEEKIEILKAQRGTYPAHVHRRLLTLKLKAIDGMRSDEIASIVGIHKTSVNRILARYKKEGIRNGRTGEGIFSKTPSPLDYFLPGQAHSYRRRGAG